MRVLNRVHPAAEPQRREFLRAGLAAFGSLSLPGLLRLRAEVPAPSARERTAVIVVWLRGGGSHLDTYDPKPDAPAEYRGPFTRLATRTPGLRLTELLPRHASISDRFTILRSMAHTGGGHPAGSLQLLSGDPDAQDKLKPVYPDFMSVAHRLRFDPRRPLPNYIGVNPIVRYDNFTIAGPAYLGESYAPFAVTGDPNAPNFRVPNIGLADPGEERQLTERASLYKDPRHAAPRPRPLPGHRGHGPLSGAGPEPAHQPRGGEGVRPEPGEPQGPRPLRPQRLGAATADGPPAGRGRRGDHHHGVERPAVRPGAELGRPRRQPPRLRGAEVPGAVLRPGRDGPHRGHLRARPGPARAGRGDRRVRPDAARSRTWPAAAAGWRAGPRARSSRAATTGRPPTPCSGPAAASPPAASSARTDRRGEDVVDRRVGPQDFLATIYHHLGIDYEKVTLPDGTGRPVPIVRDGKAIPELTSATGARS